MQQRTIKPQTRFGSTFGDTMGFQAELSAFDYYGEIDYNNLCRRRFTTETHYSEFYQQVKDQIKARLGHPVVRVELDDFQLQSAIDEAISKLDYHAPDWCTQFCSFATVANIGLYELPSVVINNLRSAYYLKTLLSIQKQSGTLEFDFFLKYFQDNFLFSDFNVGDYYVMISHLEMMRKILGRDGSFNVVNNKYLSITPTPTTNTEGEVLIEFKALDSDRLHPYFLTWLHKYSTALAKGILGQIRGKYAQLPSPAGGAVLNGAALIEQSEKEAEKLINDLLYEIEEPPVFSTF